MLMGQGLDEISHEGAAKGVDPLKGRAKGERPKYLQIVEALRSSIAAGHYRNGARLPSEAELVRRFGVSRMTAVKAIQLLQQEGLLVRRVGSGTYAAEQESRNKPTFGLIIPDLGETEIFEPICKGMTGSLHSAGHSLAWGNVAKAGVDLHGGGGQEGRKEDAAKQLCQQYIDQRVSGVFFAPLEFGVRREEVNRYVLKALKAANIPVVLLDRGVVDYPGRTEYDLVALDNRRAGYIMTEHLLRQGAQRVAFLAVTGSAETVDDRCAGYREALYKSNRPLDRSLEVRIDPSDAEAVERLLQAQKVDAFLCANDNTAGQLMRTLIGLGVRIPQDVRIAGIDDVRYAHLLPVPLTTLHQPCLDIGATAIATMLDRIANPDLPARLILLNGHLVVRQSCGAKPGAAHVPAHKGRQ